MCIAGIYIYGYMERICIDCNELKELKEFNYTGWSSYLCNSCRDKRIGKQYSNKCIKCGVEKSPSNRNLKCPKCRKEDRKTAALFKLSRPHNYDVLIFEFVKRILDDKMMVTLNDINDIITYYSYITERISEYDSYKFSTQINLMFKRLVEFSRDKNKVVNEN